MRTAHGPRRLPAAGRRRMFRNPAGCGTMGAGGSMPGRRDAPAPGGRSERAGARMADTEEKVISLDARRRRTAEPAARAAVPAAQPAPADLPPLPGRLVWLHCRTCGTFEYTELAMPGGRVHNRCGTRVEESALEIDLRAEYTIAEINLERLKSLTTLLEAQRARFLEYQERLRRQGGRIEPYPLNEESAAKLPIEGIDPVLGLLVPKALAHPERRFAREAEAGSPAQAPAEAAPPAPPEPPTPGRH